MGDFMNIAQRLKSIRKSKKISQAELARISGVSQQAISNIETGYHSPTEPTIRMLASALNVPVVELFGEQEKPPQDMQQLRGDVVDMLVTLDEKDVQRVLDFVAGLQAAKTNDTPVHQ